MSGQTNNARYVAVKKQAGLGQLATGSGAAILPLTGGRGQATTQPINSAQVRRDGQSTRGRHGSRRTQGNYPGEMQLAAYDAIIASVMRGSWGAAVTISNATTGFTSATLSVSGNVITLSGGNLITAVGGPRVGDVLTFVSGVHADDRNRPLRVAEMTATSLTIADDITNVTGPEATWSLTVGRKLVNPAAGSLVEDYYTIEEYEIANDVSELFPDVRWGQLTFAMQPNGMFTVEPTWMGTGAMQALPSGDAPHFTTPTESSALPMAAIDCTLRVGDQDIGVSAFNLVIGINLSGYDQANSKLSPAVFDGSMTVSGSFTCLREDLSFVLASLGEDQLSLSVLLRPEDSETDWFAIHLPNFTIPLPDKGEFAKEGGAMTQTINIPAELVGKDTRGGAFDATTIKFQKSNA